MGSHRLKLKTKTGLCQVVSMSREQNLLGALNVSSCYLYTCLCFLVILTPPPQKKKPKPKTQNLNFKPLSLYMAWCTDLNWMGWLGRSWVPASLSMWPHFCTVWVDCLRFQASSANSKWSTKPVNKQPELEQSRNTLEGNCFSGKWLEQRNRVVSKQWPGLVS